jgi:hypothetical protein
MRARHTSIRRAPAKFKEGQLVGFSKEKLKFAKGGEKTTLWKYSEYIKLCAKFGDLCMNSRICKVNILKISFMRKNSVP